MISPGAGFAQSPAVGRNSELAFDLAFGFGLRLGFDGLLASTLAGLRSGVDSSLRLIQHGLGLGFGLGWHPALVLAWL